MYKCQCVYGMYFNRAVTDAQNRGLRKGKKESKIFPEHSLRTAHNLPVSTTFFFVLCFSLIVNETQHKVISGP